MVGNGVFAHHKDGFSVDHLFSESVIVVVVACLVQGREPVVKPEGHADLKGGVASSRGAY